jgi:quercetin dioxygenase-like cupin family protein
MGVEGRVLHRDDDVFLAMLRFGRGATIDEHAGDTATVVICLEGEGFTSVGGETAALRAGERALWPRGVPHRLWTIDSTMVTLMLERAA